MAPNRFLLIDVTRGDPQKPPWRAKSNRPNLPYQRKSSNADKAPTNVQSRRSNYAYASSRRRMISDNCTGGQTAWVAIHSQRYIPSVMGVFVLTRNEKRNTPTSRIKDVRMDKCEIRNCVGRGGMPPLTSQRLGARSRLPEGNGI